MKRILLLLCLLLCLFCCTASAATPTDIEEYAYFEDNDPGYINIELERKVYIVVDKEPEKFGDEVTLIAVLVDFYPEDNVTFQWEYAIESDEELVWILIDDAKEQTYTFILDETSVTHQYRVIVELEGIE